MTGPLNGPRPSRFSRDSNRPPDERWMAWAEDRSRDSTVENAIWITAQDVIAEAEGAARAEADRPARFETTIEIRRGRRRGDPGE